MKRKIKFVSPQVTRTVPVYLETDLLQAGSVKDNTRAVIMGQEVEVHEEAPSYTPSYWE